jgi:DNA-directed RNA polymerase subunit RPC12/RpoP
MQVSPESGKVCPRCGHTNRMSAKNCTQCGTAFFLALVDGEIRKRCPRCGVYNRESAKVCTNCGREYRTLQLTSRGQRQKWCPQCGAPRHATAKVCARCGFRFKTGAAVEAPLQQSSLTTDPIPPQAAAKPAPPPEAPIKQSPLIAEPISRRVTAAPPRRGAARPDFDLSGEPAPYISPEELDRIRGKRPSRWDNIRRFIRSLLG